MKVLIVGIGLVGQRHVRNVKLLMPDAEIGCWRQRPDTPGWRPPPGLPVDRWFYDVEDVHRWRPGPVVIANPASMHAETAEAIWSCSSYLLIEKPIADSMVGATAICRLVHYGAVPVMVGYDLRFYRPLQLVKAAIDAGRIGRPLSIRCEVGQYLPEWRPGRDYRTSVSAQKALGGGVLLELSHEIDYARWLIGDVVAVSCATTKQSDLEIDVEDTADILLRFETGAAGNIHLDMVDRDPVRRCRVVGSDGSIAADLMTGDVALRGTGEWEHIHEALTSQLEPHYLEMRHFLACCRGEAVPVVDGEDAARTLEVVLAAKRSAEERREVRL